MAKNDLAEMFQQRVVRGMRHIINRKMETLMRHAADSVVNSPIMKRVYNNSFNQGEKSPRHNITGNMYKSTTAAVFYTGQDRTMRQGVVYWAQPDGPDPTRTTLAVRERYDKPAYYRGDEVKGYPYVGQYGVGGIDGPFAGYDTATWNPQIPKRNVWTMKVAVGVDYAEFNFSYYPGHNYMIALRDYVKRYWSKLR